MEKKWCRCDLPKEVAGRFKEFCRDFHLKFETSENRNDIHFEVLVNETEFNKANAFISVACEELYGGNHEWYEYEIQEFDLVE